MGGIALFEGHIAEMQTGEGKTLTATLPAFLRALTGRGCHIVTVNDYLAAPRRATRWVRSTSGWDSPSAASRTRCRADERREAYAKDITYGTAKEIGFDFLRDRLRKGADTQGSYQRRPAVSALAPAGRSAGPARVLFRAGR